MHALVVVAHPDPNSLSHAVAQALAEGVSGAGHTVEIADLAKEGFDPRFSLNDLAVHRREIAQPADIAFEQARVDRADALVLVYPIYWWSMPALMKGWIDRVFANGWAYEEGADLKTIKKLAHLPVHLIGIAGADMRTYERHGYLNAMKTQIDHGIFGYCGAPVVTSEFLVPVPDMSEHLDRARKLGGKVFEAAANKMADAA
ncbi:NAD(P)H-dependent oxidoreductase [Bosea sp. (in: a-proteobacteria)]|uniref:NAD(P)H-dependent oxidoreductase n=1 Tax=Bosea sp. (in: a-proteobacteria) TaxID=1871050 RepID=UPI0025BA9900|nr:NAD(P)H-dependent oxidoreductase [Bosea sp. (in: a-proteobacteria)]MBR3189542.1 NAD(P)H-dependent oxidoreductase [Bosea sp. (in: a-proteobacteria)]